MNKTMQNKPLDAECQAANIVADRLHAAEVRREYRLAAHDYCYLESPRERCRHGKQKVTAGTRVQPAPS
jgi:hypothetical protein